MAREGKPQGCRNEHIDWQCVTICCPAGTFGYLYHDAVAAECRQFRCVTARCCEQFGPPSAAAGRPCAGHGPKDRRTCLGGGLIVARQRRRRGTR